jgi:hypothetical protein
MVNIVMQTSGQTNTGRQRMKESDFDESRRVVRVLPRSDAIRKYIKHPKTRVGFPAEGSAEWPNDAFTKRRIIDGDISIEAAPQPDEQQQKVIEHKSGGRSKSE